MSFGCHCGNVEDQYSPLIADLINATVKEGKVPEEWNNSYIMSLLKVKVVHQTEKLTERTLLETHRSSAESGGKRK